MGLGSALRMFLIGVEDYKLVAEALLLQTEVVVLFKVSLELLIALVILLLLLGVGVTVRYSALQCVTAQATTYP